MFLQQFKWLKIVGHWNSAIKILAVILASYASGIVHEHTKVSAPDCVYNAQFCGIFFWVRFLRFLLRYFSSPSRALIAVIAIIACPSRFSYFVHSLLTLFTWLFSFSNSCFLPVIFSLCFWNEFSCILFISLLNLIFLFEWCALSPGSNHIYFGCFWFIPCFCVIHLLVCRLLSAEYKLVFSSAFYVNLDSTFWQNCIIALQSWLSLMV